MKTKKDLRYNEKEWGATGEMTTMRKWKKQLLSAACLLAVCGMARGAFCAYAETAEENIIAEGVYIGNVSVGGMTADEAREAIDSYADAVDSAVFTLTANGKSIEVTAAELGVTFDAADAVNAALSVGKTGSLIARYKDTADLAHGGKVLELPIRVDGAAVSAVLEEKSAALNNEAVDNGLIRENGEFVFVEGSSGVEVDVEESVRLVEEYFADGWDGADAEIELAAEIVEPEGTKEELMKVKDLLGSYTTNYSSSASGRCTNISVAAGKIDGTVLYPGEEFSVAEAIAPLSAEGGYELAGSYENGQTVQSYGGGVCQVSSTLYNALILAEIEITQRSNHSMIVSYVKPSMDAAIAGDYKDLKFVNNLDAPIYIEAYTSEKNVYFNIYGEETRDENRVVSFKSEVVSEEDPGVQFVATEDPAGYISTVQSKHIGYVARLWKIVTVDGVEESREVFNKSTYKSSPKIVNVGTASADPAVTEAINAAIATGDEATVDATVAQYAATVTTTTTETAPSAEEQAIMGTVNESEITGNTSVEGQ